jgi:SAM-dependent methyltransferase
LTCAELTSCRLCSGPLVEILRLADTPIANALPADTLGIEQTYPLYLSQCRNCMHVMLPVVIDAGLLFPASYPYVSGTSRVFVQHLAEQAATVSAFCELKPNDLVVEIGSNDGTLLGLLRERGLRAIGVDPALDLARLATENGNVTLGAAFSEKIGKTISESFGKAKVVVSNNTLAHIEDMAGVFRGVREILEVGGTLVFEVGYLPDVVTTNNYSTIYHEHVAYHHLWPLLYALARHDLAMYHAHRVPTQGGSIRVYARRIDGEAPAKSAMLEQLLKEEAINPRDPSGFLAKLKSWPARIDDSTRKLYGMLTALKAQGKTIAGYGAAAKATTLLHQCGIGRDLLDCVFDANPRKIGKFLPGNHIEIVGKAELEVRQPDYCLILSGNFAESIRAQHPGFTGRWISPLPMPEILGEKVAA